MTKKIDNEFVLRKEKDIFAGIPFGHPWELIRDSSISMDSSNRTTWIYSLTTIYEGKKYGFFWEDLSFRKCELHFNAMWKEYQHEP